MRTFSQFIQIYSGNRKGCFLKDQYIADVAYYIELINFFLDLFICVIRGICECFFSNNNIIYSPKGSTSFNVKSTQNTPQSWEMFCATALPISPGGKSSFCHQTLSRRYPY